MQIRSGEPVWVSAENAAVVLDQAGWDMPTDATVGWGSTDVAVVTAVDGLLEAGALPGSAEVMAVVDLGSVVLTRTFTVAVAVGPPQ
jgi:hypothetical protein